MKDYTEEFVKINGIEQYLLHYKKKEGTPVLLYLHGGPGSCEHMMAYALDEAWGDMVTQVHWDQRGAGRTLMKSKAVPENMAQMLLDLDAVVLYLKEQYHTEKIILLGHSWGTILGSIYALQHPENVLAYIGSGQVVHMAENEKRGYERALDAAKKAGDAKQIKQLEALKSYPDLTHENILKELFVVHRIEMKYTKNNGNAILMKLMKKSPCFGFRDLLAMQKSNKANTALLREVLGFDLYQYGTNYQVPVFYLLGEEDMTTPVSLTEDYFERIMALKKKIEVIADAGHNVMYEKMQEYGEALKNIMQMLA